MKDKHEEDAFTKYARFSLFSRLVAGLTMSILCAIGGIVLTIYMFSKGDTDTAIFGIAITIVFAAVAGLCAFFLSLRSDKETKKKVKKEAEE